MAGVNRVGRELVSRVKDVTPSSETKGKFKYGRNEIVQRPKIGFPHAGFGKTGLWVKMQAIQLQSQSSKGRGGAIRTGMYGPVFKFLAPETIAEQANHNWEEYESMTSRLAEKIKSLTKTKEDIRGIKELFGGDLKKVLGGIGGNLSLARLGGANFGSNIPKVKVDTPLVYTSSARREWNLEFILASWKDAKDEIVDPVKELMKYSSPSMGQGNISIEFPWIFKITTEPDGLFTVNHAALEAVQPTWKAPYIDGNPTQCDLTLVFKDLSPLFRKTIVEGGIIKVGKLP